MCENLLLMLHIRGLTLLLIFSLCTLNHELLFGVRSALIYL